MSDRTLYLASHCAMLDLGAPLGSWPEDHVVPLDILQILQQSPDVYVYTFKGQTRTLVCKELVKPSLPPLVREISIVNQAGDCSVPYVGRYFLKPHGELLGLIMSYESVVIPSAIETRAERIRTIHELCDLVERFHARGLVHGDIKPDNLLRCSDGSLRFCDFGTSCVAGDTYLTPGPTMGYTTAARSRATTEMPTTREEDYHSLAMTIWQLFTGGTDFWIRDLHFKGDEDFDAYDAAQDALKLGRRPDMTRIDDPDIAKLILKYLDLGPPVEDAEIRTWSMCYEKTYRLRDCRCVPECTTTLKITCMCCEQAQPASPAICPRLYVEPFVRDPTKEVNTACNVNVPAPAAV